MPAGRPTLCTPEMTQAICSQLEQGIPLVRICQQEGMPAYWTVRRWIEEKPEFSAISARAKQEGTHHLADECLIIADEPLPDDPEEAKIEITHRRLKIDTRHRLIGQWNRRDYGDKKLIGSDPENPLPSGFAVRFVDANGDSE